MSLALNMIVGSNEAFELNRCLESAVLPEIFDEIVIVVTTRDPEVEKVARKFTNKVFYFEWIKDFSAARNFALFHTESEYVMWLDADDIINEISQTNMPNMKKYVLQGQCDRYLCPYYIDVNINGEFLQHGLVPRFFRNTKKLRWQKRVHEQIMETNTGWMPRTGTFIGFSVEHRPLKITKTGVLRNIEILREEYDKDPTDHHYAFYLARDCMLIGESDEALKIFDHIIKKRIGTPDHLYTAAFFIAQHYTYASDGSLKTDNLGTAETYARIAMSFSEKYAEPYVILGDVYYHRGDLGNAEACWKRAMNKSLNGYSAQEVAYYEEIPSVKLANLYVQRNDYTSIEQALYYNKIALKHRPNDGILLNNRKTLIGLLK